MLDEISGIDWLETESEIEALVLEANLIKKYKPKYNILMRDDKNYFFVGITNPNFLKKTSDWQTKEEFPKVFITHQPNHLKNLKIYKSKNKNPKKLRSYYIGPFTDGKALKKTLKYLRTVFPYCTCKKPHFRMCLNAHLENCYGYCCRKSRIMNQESRIKNLTKGYNKNINNLIAVLTGKRKSLIKKLGKEMKIFAKKWEFEKAAKILDQIESLEKIMAHRQVIDDYNLRKVEPPYEVQPPKIKIQFEKLMNIEPPIRIEAYDISNIQGTSATGSMVVFSWNSKSNNYVPDKNQYRKFKIKTVRGANDVAMIKEVLNRRFNHPEWPYPNLILIDGGIGQLSAALEVKNFTTSASSVRTLSEVEGQKSKVKSIKMMALAKKENRLFIENKKDPALLKNLPKEITDLILYLRDEAHRFAIKYHHKLRVLNNYSTLSS